MIEVKVKEDLELLKYATHNSINFSIDKFTIEENTFWRNKIIKDINPCGCETGAKVSIIVIIFSITYTLIIKLNNESITSKILLWLVICVLFSAIIGKLFGILFSKWRLKKNLNHLISLLNK